VTARSDVPCAGSFKHRGRCLGRGALR
jgi:hypothetical protein